MHTKDGIKFLLLWSGFESQQKFNEKEFPRFIGIYRLLFFRIFEDECVADELYDQKWYIRQFKNHKKKKYNCKGKLEMESAGAKSTDRNSDAILCRGSCTGECT